MKKLLSITLKAGAFMLFAYTLLLACTKEVIVQDDFDFELIINMNDSGYIYELENLNITITPDRVVSTTKYYLSYQSANGNGHFVNQIGETLEASAAEPMEITRNQVLQYLPESIGTHELTLTVTDSHGNEHSVDLTYEVNYAPFTFTHVAATSTYTINTQKPTTVTFFREATASYTFSYSVDGGTGTLFDGATEINVSTPYTLNSGAVTLNYLPTTLGTHTITATALAPDGATRTTTLVLEVVHVPFSFSATATTSSANVNAPVDITIDLSSTSSDVTYSIKHEYATTSTTGDLRNELAALLTAGDYNVITPGTYTYSFVSNSTGTVTIDFTVLDSNGQEFPDQVIIEIENIPFTFTGSPAQTEVYINQDVALSFTLTPDGTTTGINYNLQYNQSAGNGVVSSGGTTISPSTDTAVSSGPFVYNFKPTTLGVHTLNFIVTDNFGESRNVTITLNAIHLPVTFNVDAPNSLIVGEQTNISFIVTPIIASSVTYQMNYYYVGGTSELLNGGAAVPQGTFEDISTGNFTYQWTASQPGTYTLTFQLQDSNGQIITVNKTITVLNNDFNLTVTPPTTVFVNEAATFVFALVPTNNVPGTVYQMSYDVQNPNIGNFSGQSEGVPFTITPVSFNLDYTPTTIGTHQITFTVNDGITTHIYTETIEVVAADFSWTANASNSSILVNTSDTINANLSQSVTNASITYSLDYSISGPAGSQLLYGGSPLVNSTAITPGNYQFDFSASAEGTYNIILTVTDSNGLVHPATTITYTVTHTDFSINCLTMDDLYVNDYDTASAYLTQTVTDASITYEIMYSIAAASTGNGTLTDSSGNSIAGIYQPIAVGSANAVPFTFTATTAGAVEIITTIRELNNVSTAQMCSINFSVLDFSYAFTGDSQDNPVYIGQETSLNFNISETPAVGYSYEMKYAYTSGSGTVSLASGTAELTTNLYTPVTNGNYTWNFKAGAVAENVVLHFVAKNLTTNVETAIDIPITVQDYPPCTIGLSAIETTNTANVGDIVTVNMNFTETGVNCNATYKMSFATTGPGVNLFKYNGVDYTAGQLFVITPGTSAGTYKGVSAGTHNITFTIVKDGDAAITASSTPTITFNEIDFTWIATASNSSILVNTSDTINANLSQSVTNTSITYSLDYSISGPAGSQLLYGGSPLSNGTIITPGNYQFDFSASAEGTYNIILTVTDSNGLVHPATTITYIVTHTDFNIYCSSMDDLYENDSDTFTTYLTQNTTDSSIQYEIKYNIAASSTGSGTLTDSSSNNIEGLFQPIGVGASAVIPYTFTATTAGAVEITAVIQELSNPSTAKTCSINFSVLPFSYTFTGDSQDDPIYVGQETSLNFNINETPAVGYSYEMKYAYTSGSGTVSLSSGTAELTTNLYTPVTNGNYTWNFKAGAVAENVVLHFVAKNLTTNVETAIDIPITVQDYPPCTNALTATALSSTANVGNAVAINLDFSETGVNCNETYSMRFTTTGTGTFTYNGTTYSAGVTTIPIVPGATSGSYQGTTNDTHNITFEIFKDSDLGTVVASDNTSIDFNNPTFTISCNGGGDVNTGESIAFTNTLDQSFTDNSIQYEARYSITSGIGNGTVSDDTSTLLSSALPTGWVLVNIGNTTRYFNATVAGNVTLQTEIREVGTGTTDIHLCTNNFNIVEENCDFTFTTCYANNGTAAINTSQAISLTFTVPTPNNCNTDYMMYYTTTRDGVATTDGYLTYNGLVKLQNSTNAFQVLPGSVDAYFNTSVAGEYVFTFHILNDNATNTDQTLSTTINFISPSITVTQSSIDDSVFTLDTTSYNYDITDGSGNYSVSISQISGVNLNPGISINSTSTTLGLAGAINVGTTLNINLTPTEVGTAIYRVRVEDINTSVITEFDINLISNQPQFIINNVSVVDSICWSDDTTTLNFTVDTSGYNHNLTYQITDYGIIGQATTSGSTLNGVPNVSSSVIIDPDDTIFGNQNITLTIQNVEYGYSQTITTAISIKDVLFDFNTVLLSAINSSTETISEHIYYNGTVDLGWYYVDVHYFDKLKIEPYITMGKYDIDHSEITFNWFNGSEFYQKGVEGEDINGNPCTSGNYDGNMNPMTPVSKSNISTNIFAPYNGNIILNNIGSTNDNCHLGANVFETVNTTDIVVAWKYQLSTGKELMRNLDFPLIETIPGEYTPTMTIKIWDSNGNLLEHTYTLDNGWGNYIAD